MPISDHTTFIIRTLEKCPLLQNCPEKFLHDLASHAQTISLSKGQILFVNNDPANRFYIIQAGWIKLFRETLEGTQAVIDILTHGHMFGETSIFQNDQYPYTAESVEETGVLSLPISILKNEIDTNPQMALNMLSAMAHYRRQQDLELEHRTLQNAPQRIGCFLLRLANQNQEGKARITLPYDKTLVAARLGMQPETFSRALSKLRQETGIHVKGAAIDIDDLTNLSEYACAACTSEFPCKDLSPTKKT